MMKFLTAGEKLRKLRHQLNIEQDVLTQIGVSRNFISMIENNKRKLTESRAIQITQLLKNIALDKNIIVHIPDDYLIVEPSEEAKRYCLTTLDNIRTSDEANKINEVIKKYKLDIIKPKYYITLADKSFDEKDYTQAFIYYLDALDSYKNINDFTKTPYIYNRLGRCRSSKLDFQEALFYFAKSYESSLHYSDEKTKKIVLYNMAWCSIKTNNLDAAFNFINRYLELCNPKENLEDYIRGSVLKADYYVSKQELTLATNLYADCIKLFEDDSSPFLGYIYNNLGDVSMKLGLNALALDYLDKAKYIREQSDKERVSYTLLQKAKLYINQNNYEEALLQAIEAIDYAKSFKDKECQYKCYSLLETIYKHFNNGEKLKQIYTEMLALLDGVNARDTIIKTHAKLSIIDLQHNNIDSCLIHLENIVDM